ncbi:ATP-binding protein [Myxococcaceae bacterium GXIMD 01537]
MSVSAPYQTLAEFLRLHHDRLVGEWTRLDREHLAAPWLTHEELVDNIPEFLSALADALETMEPGPWVAVASGIPRLHARLRRREGFTIEQVTREYALLRRVLLDAFLIHHPTTTILERERLHAALDEAIVESVSTYTHEATRALDLERQRFLLALRNSLIVVFEQDSDLRYTWIHNPQLGVPASAIVGRTDPEVFTSPEDVERLVAFKQRVLDTGQAAVEEVHTAIGEREGYYLLALEPIRDEQGRVRGLLGAATDVTARRMEAEQLRRALEFRDRVIGIVSHDLRNPLSAISLGAALLLRRRDLDNRQRDTLARILSSAERSSRLIRDLLDYTKARMGSGIPIEPRPARLDELMRQAVDEALMVSPQRIIYVDQEPGDYAGRWDGDRIAQVLTNLLGNALQHSPEQTPVWVRVRARADAVDFEVSNEGEPLAPETLPELFEPFTRGPRAEVGQGHVGLGLYISRVIVESHQGHIDATSDEHATTFRVTLPRVPEVPVSAPPAEAPSAPPHG